MTIQELNARLEQTGAPVEGVRLPESADTLQDVLASDQLVILHFLRHLGCIYCKYTVDQLNKISKQSAKFPTIYFVHQSSPEAGEAFFAERFPGARHISDPGLKLYKLFGVRRLGGLQLLNPKMIWQGFMLTFKGYRNKIGGTGDIFILSATFLFNKGKAVWQRRAKYAGDEPDFAKLGK